MKLQVCIVSYRFPPEYSGAGKRASEFADYLYERGHNVIVISSKFSNAPSNTSDKYTVFYYPRVNFRYPFKSMLEALNLILKLYSKRNYYDYIFIYGRLSLTASFLHLLKKKIIYRAAMAGYDDFLTLTTETYCKWYYRILYRLIDYHWIISNDMIKGLQNLGTPESRIIYSPNGVNIANDINVKSISKKLAKSDRINFLFIGEISYRKGTDLLISLFSQIVKLFPNAHLNVCGPNGNQYLYEKLIKLPNITYYGVVDSIYEIIKENDFFLFPTKKEGFPTALIEAMSCGLVCVASKLPVIEKEIIDNEVDGFCVDFRDQQNVVKLISHLIANNSLRYSVSKNAILKVKNKFLSSNNFDKVINKILEK